VCLLSKSSVVGVWRTVARAVKIEQFHQPGSGAVRACTRLPPDRDREVPRDAADLLVLLKTDPLMDPLRKEPRFEAVMRELNFSGVSRSLQFAFRPVSERPVCGNPHDRAVWPVVADSCRYGIDPPTDAVARAKPAG
jgi:hypothetical protein